MNELVFQIYHNCTDCSHSVKIHCLWRPLGTKSKILLTKRTLLLDMISEFLAAICIKVAVRTL